MQYDIRKICYLGIMIAMILCSSCKRKEIISLEEDNLETTPVVVEEKKEKEEKEEKIDEKNVFVFVCGAVVHPGVYEVSSDSRLFEVIEIAGGFTSEADMAYLNQAEQVQDGERIYVPTIEETKKSADGQEALQEHTDGKINLNTASKEQLMTITGVGEAKADSIIRYREEHGGFQKIEDIMNIEGIKEGVFNKIKEQIVVK